MICKYLLLNYIIQFFSLFTFISNFYSRMYTYILLLDRNREKVVVSSEGNVKNYINLLGVQISSVRFSKHSSSYCEWFIVTADFSGFREVKHLLIIFSLYRFEFHILIFTVFEMSNFVLTKQHLREVFCFN